MPKKKRTRRNGFGRAAAKIENMVFTGARIGSLIAPQAGAVLHAKEQGWGTTGMLDQWLQTVSGYSFVHRQFYWENLAKGWTPYIATTLVTSGVKKIRALINSIMS